MKASFKVDVSGLKRLAARFDSPTVKAELDKIPQKKAVAAIVAQAIADNFAQEGPGWAPLKAATIRYSVSKKMRKKLADMTDKQLMRHEARARKAGTTMGVHRMILQKSKTLMKSVTTPGAQHNIYSTEGTKLIWGSDLVYAAVHNKGSPKKNIPKREYLVLHQEWKDRLYSYITEQALTVLKAAIKGNA